MDGTISALLGAIVGGLMTFLVELYVRKNDAVSKLSNHAAMLYYDLKSIQNYINKDRACVDLRFSENWQEFVVNCTFLNSAQIELLYEVYDKIYNFDYTFNRAKNVGSDADKDNHINSSGLKEYLTPDGKFYGDFERTMNQLKEYSNKKNADNKWYQRFVFLSLRKNRTAIKSYINSKGYKNHSDYINDLIEKDMKKGDEL